VYDELDKGLFTAGLYVDFRKAFDSVVYTKLLQKLRLLNNTPTYILKIISHYLQQRTFSIRCNKTLSKPFCLNAGVPQGSVLGPILFIVYINDLCKPLTNTDLYADDVACTISASSHTELKQKLTSSLEYINCWCDNNGMSINFDKTVFLIYCKPRKSANPSFTNFYINDNPVQRVYNFKYLRI